MQLFVDPVVCSDGISYERKYIQKWIGQGKTRSPVTGEELDKSSMVPNRSLLSMVDYLTEVAEPTKCAFPEEVEERSIQAQVFRMESLMIHPELFVDRTGSYCTETSTMDELALKSRPGVEIPLCCAARDGDLEGVRKLVERGADVNAMMLYHDEATVPIPASALGWAAAKGHTKVVSHLCDLPKSPQPGGRGFSLLRFAVFSRDLELVKLVVNEYGELVNKDKKNHYQITPLMGAVATGSLDIVKYMCEELHVNIDTKGPLGMTALHYAAVDGRMHLARYLIEAQACRRKRGRNLRSI